MSAGLCSISNPSAGEQRPRTPGALGSSACRAPLGEDSKKFFFSKNAAEFAEGEERDEGAEDDDGSGNHRFELQLVEDGSRGFVMVEAFDELLQEMKGEDEDAEDERFEKGGLVERAGFCASTEVHHLADEDDLGDDESVNDGKGVAERIGAVSGGDEVGIRRDGAEERGQVDGDDGVAPEFEGGSLLQTRCGCILCHGNPFRKILLLGGCRGAWPNWGKGTPREGRRARGNSPCTDLAQSLRKKRDRSRPPGPGASKERHGGWPDFSVAPELRIAGGVKSPGVERVAVLRRFAGASSPSSRCLLSG
jgi:hypothetical protein